jgi:hypothetical protein
MNPPCVERVCQRFDDVLLPDYIFELARTPFTSKNLMSHLIGDVVRKDESVGKMFSV